MAEIVANATIVAREDLGEDLAIIRVAPDTGRVTEFEPGQYAEIAFPEEGAEHPHRRRHARRPYSIASPRKITDHLEFFVVLVPTGEFTPRLFSCSEGTRLWLNPKVKGKFTLGDVPPGQDLIMISTGTGIAPFVSMLREYHGQNRWRRLAMVHCVRYVKDLGYRGELEELAAADPNFIYLPTVTREPEMSPWSGERGRVQELFTGARFERLTGIPVDSTTAQVLLCGNPQMIDSMVEILGTRGFREHHKKNPGQIHLERYWG